MTAKPHVTTVNVHNVRAENVQIDSAGSTVWLNLGPVSFFATPDELAELGNEIVRQATALKETGQ